MKPDGGYFIICDVSKVKGFKPDQDFSTLLTTKAGVTSIPMGAFYSPSNANKVQQFVRFAFCKELAMLQEGSDRLSSYFK